jgi:hypothetical protein
MKKYTIILIAILVSSCGAFKKIKDKYSQKTKSKTDSTATVEVKIIRHIDTVIVVKGSQSEAVKPLKDVVSGGDSLVLDDSKQRVVVKYDPITKQLKAQAIVKDAKHTVKVLEVYTKKQKTKLKAENKTNQKAVKVEKQRKGSSFGSGVRWTVFVIVLLIFVALEFRRRMLR